MSAHDRAYRAARAKRARKAKPEMPGVVTPGAWAKRASGAGFGRAVPQRTPCPSPVAKAPRS